MAIIDNRVTEDGDILIIKTDIPIVGLISLSNFIDTTSEESETDFFLKEFRYSIDGGLNFTDWITLNILNISNIQITKYNQFVIEYRYTRIGDTPEVELTFEDILVSGTYEELPYPIYNSTYFKQFFEVVDINVYGWALNVLEKLYQEGILPKYMVRGETSNNILEDEDFIVFWNSITHYFAIIVYMARQLRKISLNPILVEKFLINRGIEIGNSTIEELLYMFENWISEYSDRGTFQIIRKKVEDNVNGELLRLIGYINPEEFIFAHIRPDEIGWCIGKSSPCWKGTENILNLIKGYEFTKEVEDLSLYPLIGEDYISLSDDKINIYSVPSSNISGLSYDNDQEKMIIVSPNLDYEISFFIEVTSTSTLLTFGIEGFDAINSSINIQSVVDGVNRNEFFVRKVLNQANKTYFIRGILWNKDRTLDISSYMYPGGVHLKSNSNLRFIVPKIYLDNSLGNSSGNMKIWNIKVRPLNLNFSRGQLGIKEVIVSYMNTDKSLYDQVKIEDIIQSKMINLGQKFKAKYL